MMTKILVVDDSKSMHIFFRNMLSEFDIEIVDAFNGNEAIEAAKNFEANIVFLDVVMPEKDGIETLKELMAINPNMSVVMVSSMGTKEKITEALRLGAVDFIQKPFDEDDLIAQFEKYKVK